MSALTIKKTTGGIQTDISSGIDWTSIQWTQVLTKEVSRLQFNIRVTPGKTLPIVNDQIDMYKNGTHLFGGTVVEIDTVVQGGILLMLTVYCIDWSFASDKILVKKTYANMDPHDIVLDIISNFAPSITTTNVQTGNFKVASIQFNYQPVTKCLQKLATQIGWEWYIDPDKDLHFFLVEDNPAPFVIDDTSGNLEWSTLDKDENLQNMKNSVYVIGGTYPKIYDSTTTPDTYITDGIQTVYGLAYPYFKDAQGALPAMTVTLGGVSQSIGIDQQSDPATVQVLYNNKNRFIRFTSVPASGQTIKVYGAAKIPILAHAQDAGAIATYGEHQDVVIDQTIASIQEAQERAQAEILQFGHAVYTVKFNTLKDGLVIGMQLQVNSTIFNFNETLTVKRFTAVGYSPDQLEYQVECYGSDAVTFTDIMATLLQQQNNANPVDDSTILEILLNFYETLSDIDDVTLTERSGPYVWGDSTPEARYDFATFS